MSAADDLLVKRCLVSGVRTGDNRRAQSMSYRIIRSGSHEEARRTKYEPEKSLRNLFMVLVYCGTR